MGTNEEFRTFEDLEVYQAARSFRVAMYRVARNLPEFEKFGLVSQVRRAAVSLTNNIVEGHGRYHYLDQIKFILQARGSLQELGDDLNICSDEHYLSEADVVVLKDQSRTVAKLIGGYIRYLRKCKTGQSLAVRENPAQYHVDEEIPD